MAQKVATDVAWSVLRLGLAGFLGCLFIYAGAVKVMHPDAFLKDIESYHLVSYRIAYFTSLYLPWLEISCGLALIFKFLYLESLLILSVLVTSFTGFLISAWVRGLNITCGCFGGKAGDAPNYPWLVTRDLLILGGLILLMAMARQRWPREAAANALAEARSAG